MGVMSFQELLEMQADVMGDLIDEYKGWKIHQNFKFGTLLQNHGDSWKHDEASQSGLHQNSNLSWQASIFGLINNQPLFHGCYNDQDYEAARAGSCEIVIASNFITSSFFSIEVEVRESYFN